LFTVFEDDDDDDNDNNFKGCFQNIFAMVFIADRKEYYLQLPGSSEVIMIVSVGCP